MTSHSVESIAHRVWAYVQLLPALLGVGLFLAAVYLQVVPHPDVPRLIAIPAWVYEYRLDEPFYRAIIGAVGLALALWPLRPPRPR